VLILSEIEQNQPHFTIPRLMVFLELSPNSFVWEVEMLEDHHVLFFWASKPK